MTSDREETIGDRLRSMRIGLGLTLEEMGSRLGVTKGYVSHVETGHRKPTLDWVHGVAIDLGVDPHTLDSRLASNLPRKRKSPTA